MSATLKQKIAAVFDEPGCEKNQAKSDKERKKGCTKQLQPGAAAGGCAFDGAKIALQPIVDVAHLVHGPIACEGNSWDNRTSFSSGPKLYRTGFTTDINELDVVYGGEKRLYKSIREIIEKYDPPAVREHREGSDQHLQADQPGPGRDLLDRPDRDQGRRR